MPIEAVERAAGEMLKLGVESEVLEPPELRTAWRLKAERLLALYAR